MGTGAWHTGRTRVADYGRIDRHVVAAFLDYLEPHGGRAWLWENREEVRKTPFRGWDILFAKVEFNAKISIPDHYVEDFEQERIVDLALCDAEMCH